ncbi:hypothetical protein BpHYR1_023384 [Brachionus plicatilis]|uniref:Uncharacterized protein n=1 Tax=Brachionus plicatilis TaxID=10195 RepID=A0A3M7QIY7_BRAPC|nr:hypothetical protein BpHYR1_023384 [Brachionus plicatilis]
MRQNQQTSNGSEKIQFTIKASNISYQLNLAFPKFYFIFHGILFLIASIYLVVQLIYQSIHISKFIYILFINFATVLTTSILTFLIINKRNVALLWMNKFMHLAVIVEIYHNAKRLSNIVQRFMMLPAYLVQDIESIPPKNPANELFNYLANIT